MKNLFFAGIFLVTTFICLSANAQTKNITISGKVSSFEESLGLEGVSIEVKGTKKTSGTQADGTYSIIVTPEDKALVFILEGYQTQELALPATKGYDITLKRTGNNIAASFIMRENNPAKFHHQ